MRKAPRRLEEARRILLLDNAGQAAFDDITRMLAQALQVPMTMVNVLEADRDWFKSSFGVRHKESPAVTSFCSAFFETSSNLILVEDTLRDDRFASHPLVVGWPFVRFYGSARLVVRGQTVGTLCAYDARPRQITEQQLDQLRTLASCAIDLLENPRQGTGVRGMMPSP